MQTSDMTRAELVEQTRRSALGGFRDYRQQFLARPGCSRLTIGLSDLHYARNDDGSIALYGGTACYCAARIGSPCGCEVWRITSDEAAAMAERLTRTSLPGQAVAAWHNIAVIQPATMLVGYCALPVEGLTSNAVIIPIENSCIGWTLTRIICDYRKSTNAQWQQQVSRAAELIMRFSAEAQPHAPAADCAA